MYDKKRVFKIVTSGEGAVGKTTFLHRFVNGTFIDDLQMTLGVEFFKKDIEIGDTLYELIIWDFGGQEQFRSLLTSYIEGTSGAFLMFDLTSIERTLRNIEEWLSILKKRVEIPILLVGAKYDLIDEKHYSLYKKNILEIKEKYNFIDYIETSSKTGLNVEKAFETLIKTIEKKLVY